MSWVIFLFGLAGRATAIVLGFERNLSASFLIGGGIVAENSKICRFAGNLVQIFSMSGMNPMSSIRSASSMTRRLQPVSRILPRSNRSEEHTSELQSLMRISYAVFCLKNKTQDHI